MSSEPRSVHEIFRQLHETNRDCDTRSVRSILDTFGARSYGPAIFVPAIIAVSPVGAIPTMPTTLAIVVVVIAVQILMNRDHLWLPGFISNRTISADKLGKGLDKMTPLARWMDRHFRGRYPGLTGDNSIRAAACACILLALLVPPLEFLPFASAAPMGTIALFGLAILARDGLLMIGGLFFTFCVYALGIWLIAGL